MHEGGSSDENEDIVKSIRRHKLLEVSNSNDSINNRVKSNPKKTFENQISKTSPYNYKDALYDTFACC